MFTLKIYSLAFSDTFSLCSPQQPSKPEAASSDVAVYVLAFI
jgi:hypothetical protein